MSTVTAAGRSASGPATNGTATAPGWHVVVSADRAHFDRVEAWNGPDPTIAYPRFCPERRFPLTGEQVLIGRRSRSRGSYPDIDLAGPPEDVAVSHLHALLVAQPDGGWAVVDLRSANCTFVNDADDPIQPELPVPLADGDHIHVGSFTRITLRATPL
ncbi:FHA domain-containing protein [Dactylosporangium sp. NBC_01737]|uniref:FHA domain-containing protein n=1 Tax=Dactylosporangium sp. NBC_01737 TaxID=2975959 RepID=UPI002E13BA1D|nr:FHA domain-containing protein [Dactylosporangium sp. NBC_01737]